MTTALLVPSPIVVFRRSGAFWPVVALTVVLAAVASVYPAPDWVSVVVVVVVVAALGIPHGAVDHLVAEAIVSPSQASSRRRFMRNYVLAMLAVGSVWLVAPAFALVGFLALSVHHFGQSDLADLGLPATRATVVQWSRGLLLVGLPLVAHLGAVSPVIERLGGGDPSSWTWLADRSMIVATVLVAQHVAAGWTVTRGLVSRSTLGREAVAVAALTALFLMADPLLAFAVYFGLWHSLTHLFVLADVLGTGPAPLRSILRLAAPLTATSVVVLVLVVLGAVVADRVDLIVPAVFVFVSMLTLPHMVTVERLWRRRRVPCTPSRAPGP